MDIPFPGYNSDPQDQPAPLRSTRAQVSRPHSTHPAETILDCFAAVLDRMSDAEIATLRTEIVRRSGDEHEFVDVIDGHLALRNFAGQA